MTLALAEKATVIQKICPLPSELSFITKNIPCPEEGCNGTFLNSSNLEMHLSKHHKKRSDGNNKRDSSNKTNCQYHCPVEKCLYNINSDRYFSHIKYLKQHYLKVHAEKKFLCKKCDKGFSTEAARNVHVRICGMKFSCSCGCTYLSYEALITHAKRKNHTFDANLKLYAKGQAAPKVLPIANNETGGINCSSTGGNALTLIGNSKKSPYILLNTPGQSLAGLPLNVQPLSTLLPAISPSPISSGIDIGVQTERGFGCNGRRTSCGNSGSRRLSAQTQTWSVKRSKICAGTQTQGDYILKRAMRAAQIPISDTEDIHVKGISQSLAESGKLPGPGGRKRKKSMETQTVVSTEESSLLSGKAIPSSELASRQQRRLIEGVIAAEQNGEEVNPVNHNMNFVQLPSQNSYQVPMIDPWIDVYPKCNSGTQTSPLSAKSICHPVVTQTDLTGILLQESLNNCQNQNIQCFYPLPESAPIVSGNMTVDSDSGIPDLVDVTTNIDAADFTDSDFTTTRFDPMFASEKLTLIEEVNPHAGNLDRESRVTFRDPEVDLVGSMSTETQTEGESTASDPTLSHIETQTNTEDFLSCCFEQLLHANMCTQTCEDMLFSELGFSDIQTQTQEEIRLWQNSDPPINETAANSLAFLVSTETQTAISGRCPTASAEGGEDAQSHLWMSETSHMETQTDVDELRKLIAELTKHDIEGD